MSSERIQSVRLEQLDERYGVLRLVTSPRGRSMLESVRRFGQLTPIVVSAGESLCLVDGFKRLAAARTLQLDELEALHLPLSEPAALAAMYSLNRHHCRLLDFEEALLVRELYRSHNLTQPEIAELLGHHKSWVCRRLSFIERLDEAVQADMRAGLLSPSVVRELVRFPRGQQREVAAAIHRAGLTAREAAQLVSLFEQRDARGRLALLERPRETLADLNKAAPAYDPRLGREANRLRRCLARTSSALAQLGQLLNPSATWTAAERDVLSASARQLEATLPNVTPLVSELGQRRSDAS